jgi:hypothetical protein
MLAFSPRKILYLLVVNRDVAEVTYRCIRFVAGGLPQE